MTVDLTTGQERRDGAAENARVDEIRLQIIGSFCHDIRQPLTAALLRASALSEELHQSSHRAALRDLQMSLREIATTSETVFDAVRLSRAEVSVQSSFVYLPKLYERLDAVFRSQADAKGLAIRFASHRVVAETDESLLLRLLQNVVSNAIKFTARGAILVTCRKVDRVLRCEVRDSGAGMSASELAALSSPAPGLRVSTNHGVESAGIGLWNARQFAKLLGARLQITSKPARGTRVRLDVPCRVERREHLAPVATRTDGSDERSVMVLSGDPENCKMAEQAFIGLGWTCSVYDDALKFLATINMPGLRPTAVVIPARVGNITAAFLLRILASRFESLQVIVHLETMDQDLIDEIRPFAARLVVGDFTPAAVPTFD